jgi:hypothetical protein
MNAFLPARPKPAVRSSSYAADFDEAERASSGTEHPKAEVTATTTKFGTAYERLSRSSTAGKISFWNDLVERSHPW